jgi:hypothetical protein
MFFFLDTVVDQNWAVHQLAYLGTLTNRGAYARISAKQIEVIEKGVTESQSSIGIIFGDVANDFREIVQRLLRVEEVVIHLGRRLRASRAGTVRRALESFKPSSMAASVS